MKDVTQSPLSDSPQNSEPKANDAALESWPVRSGDDSLSSAVDLLKVLRACGVNEFNAAQFCFLESLITRSEGKNDGVVQRLLVKFNDAVNAYREDFVKAKSNASRQLKSIASDFSESSDVAQSLYDAHQYRQLNVYVSRLNQGKSSNLNELSVLTETLRNQASRAFELSLSGAVSEAPDKKSSFQECDSRQQDTAEEANPVDSMSDKSEVVDSTSNREAPVELKVLQPLRESWAKLNAEKLVMRSINEGPENAGPLNPHYLAIRSLSNMRDLSPHYLNRFVSYMETLLWLEQSAGKKPGSKRKKATRK